MNTDAENYLKSFSSKLHGMTQTEKDDIVQEIRAHIEESLRSQNSVDNILKKLGPADRLARAYSNEYYLENNVAKPSLIFQILFFGAAGLSGIAVVPALFIISVVFALTPIGVMGITVTNFMNITNIPMNFVMTPLSPGLPQFIAGGIVSVILIMGAIGCYKLLQKYLRTVSAAYHKMRLK